MAILTKEQMKGYVKVGARLGGSAVVSSAKLARNAFNQASAYFLNKKYLKKWPNKYISPKERQQLREIYFKARGYDFEIPTDSEERAELLSKILSSANPDYEAAIMLFDPELDRNNTNWLFCLGYIYSELDFNEKNFKPHRGMIINLENAKLGNASTQYNLGVFAARGFDSEPDIAQAEFWYLQAHKNGNTNAYNALINLRENNPDFYIGYYSIPQVEPLEFDVLLLNDETSNGSEKLDIDFVSLSPEDKVEFLINRAYSLKYNTYEGQQNIRSRIISGRSLGLEKFDINELATQREIDNYIIEIRGENHYDSHYECACSRMAIRCVLSIGVDFDCAKANDYLDKIPNRDETKKIDVRSRLQFLKREVRELARKMAAAQWQYHDVRKVVNGLVEGEFSFDLIHQHIDSGEIKITDQMIEYLNQVENIMMTDDSQNRDEWRDLLAHAQSKRLGYSLEQLRKSTMHMGPVYNDVNKDSGLPILGHLLRAASSQKDANQTYTKTGMFVPTEGIVNLKGIKAFDNGTFVLDVDSTEKGSGIPAMILPEDIDVALVIVFGEKIALKHVYLSIENPESDRVRKEYGHHLKHDHSTLRHKVWSPKWIGQTHLGRTLFATDHLIARTCWNLNDFDIVASQNALSTVSVDTMHALVEDLNLTGGRTADANSQRVMIRPVDHVVITSHYQNKAFRKSYHHIAVEQFDMFVEGDYSLGEQGMIARDDPTFEHGRMTQKLTKRFNDIATAMPIFERGRQLTMMLYAFQKLRDSGWKPNHILQGQIEQATKHYTSLPQQDLDDLLMQPLPFKTKGPRV